jgi:hypothetical protein
MNSIKDMVKDKVVRFEYYRDGELWYRTEDGFQFPVPVSDTGSGVFKAEDKAILYMRWIRKQVDVQKSWDLIRSGGGPGSTCNKEQWETSIEDYTQPKELSRAGTEVEELPEGEDFDLEPQTMSEASARVLNSILRARIPEENILRFTEEDLEDQP